MKDDIVPWEPSPRGISDEETKSRFLGDTRCGNLEFNSRDLS
jgi:hypothetical protein